MKIKEQEITEKQLFSLIYGVEDGLKKLSN